MSFVNNFSLLATTTDAGEESCPICGERTADSIWVSIIQGLVGIVIFTENFICGIAVMKTYQIKKALRVCLIMLSLMDALTGIVFMYVAVISEVIPGVSPECYARYSVVGVITVLSRHTVCTMTLERIIALYLPLRYDSIINNRNLLVYFIINAIYGVIFPFAVMTTIDRDQPICDWILISTKFTNLILGVYYGMVMTMICVGNLVILALVRKHIKAIIPVTIGENKTTTGFKMNFKATLTTASIVIPSIICYAPFTVFCIYLSICSEFNYDQNMFHASNVVHTLSVLNSVINPFIYCWRMPELRKTLKAMLKC